MAQIHATALVDPRAELGRDVVIGPWCIVEAGAVIGDGCRLAARSVVKSRTTLGCDNEIGEGAVIGGAAQHVHVHDPGGTLTIGSHNRIRENVTIHRGWNNDAATTLGDHNMLMVGSHVGHDCRVGSHCILVNHVLLGGHVHVDDRAYLGGGVGRASVLPHRPPGDDRRTGKSHPGRAAVRHDRRRRPHFAGRRPQQSRPAAQRLHARADRPAQGSLSRDLSRRPPLERSAGNPARPSFATGPAAAFHEFFKTGKRGFIQERRISRKATLKIVDPARETMPERRAAARSGLAASAEYAKPTTAIGRGA